MDAANFLGWSFFSSSFFRAVFVDRYYLSLIFSQNILLIGHALLAPMGVLPPSEQMWRRGELHGLVEGNKRGWERGYEAAIRM